MKIFIVENHRDTLAYLRMYCEDFGHEVESATTLEDSVEKLGRIQVDLLFCDIGLPDGTGWELMQRVNFPKPVFAVAMSGFGMNADNTRSREAGFRHHLLKPFKVAELDRILAEASEAARNGLSSR